MAIAVKRGFIRLYRPEKQSWETALTGAEHHMPSCVAMGDSRVFFSDLSDGKIYTFPIEGAGTETEFFAPQNMPLALEVSDDGRVLVGTADGVSLVEQTQKDGNVQAGNMLFFKSVRYQYYWLTMFFRGLLVAVVLASGFVAFTLISRQYESEEEKLIENMK